MVRMIQSLLPPTDLKPQSKILSYGRYWLFARGTTKITEGQLKPLFPATCTKKIVQLSLFFTSPRGPDHDPPK